MKTEYCLPLGSDYLNRQSATFSIFSVMVKRSKGQSAVEKASYISRSVLVGEFDGQIYRPKYHENLVHSEITLPPNAPKEYADRATLWNAVDLSEKGQKLNRLKELSKMYALFAPIQATYKESQSLKGLVKMKYDKEHKDSL